MSALTIRLPNSVHQKIKELAERDQISVNHVDVPSGKPPPPLGVRLREDRRTVADRAAASHS